MSNELKHLGTEHLSTSDLETAVEIYTLFQKLMEAYPDNFYVFVSNYKELLISIDTKVKIGGKHYDFSCTSETTESDSKGEMREVLKIGVPDPPFSSRKPSWDPPRNDTCELTIVPKHHQGMLKGRRLGETSTLPGHQGAFVVYDNSHGTSVGLRGGLELLQDIESSPDFIFVYTGQITSSDITMTYRDFLENRSKFKGKGLFFPS